MTAVLRLHGGGSARIERLAGEQLTMRASHASPPGSMLAAELAEARTVLSLKVRACRRDGNDFLIEARLINLSREQRNLLETLVNAPDRE